MIRSRCHYRAGLALALALLLPTLTRAGERTWWEVGAGFGGLSIPDYRGSDQQRAFLVPLPYVQYHGKRLRIDREGVHGALLAQPRLRLELSLGAGIPVSSSSNPAREGMPDLDPTFEVGPSLEYDFESNPEHTRIWTLALPVRAVFGAGFWHVQQHGWVVAPYLGYRIQPQGEGAGWSVSIAVGPIYGSEEYHSYYYQVAPEFATPIRPAYNARGGYSGSRVTISASRRFGRFWIGAFARYDNLSGSVIAHSPLVKDTSSFMGGGGIAWVFAGTRPGVEADPR